MTKYEEVNITCHALGVRPVPQLTWMGKHTYKELQQNETRNTTFDVTSTLTFHLTKENNEKEVFTCRSRIDVVNVTDDINVTLIKYGKFSNKH